MVPSVDSARICALLVGIDQYDEIGSLKNGVADAKIAKRITNLKLSVDEEESRDSLI